MPNIKYGPVNQPGRTSEKGFAASEVFHEKGAAFTQLGSGLVEALAAADTAIFGYALLGFSFNDVHVSGAVGSRIFTTSATSGTKYTHMAASPSTVYFVPMNTAFVLETHQGLDCDIAVTSNKMMVNPGATSTKVVRIVDGRDGDSEVWVQIPDAKIQLT